MLLKMDVLLVISSLDQLIRGIEGIRRYHIRQLSHTVCPTGSKTQCYPPLRTECFKQHSRGCTISTHIYPSFFPQLSHLLQMLQTPQNNRSPVNIHTHQTFSCSPVAVAVAIPGYSGIPFNEWLHALPKGPSISTSTLPLEVQTNGTILGCWQVRS